MFYFVYIIYSETIEKYYTGSCKDFQERLSQHNGGYSRYTKAGIPWILVKLITTQNRTEALQLENKIKKRGAKRFLIDLEKQ